ncbi:hypothetical protein GS481_02800 [Rhodococcus hoagii]|nr:hypothetical protein [Prescottella equi]
MNANANANNHATSANVSAEIDYRRLRQTAIAMFIGGVFVGLVAALAAVKIWLDQQMDAQPDWVVVQLFGLAAIALLLVASAVSIWAFVSYSKKMTGEVAALQR